MKPLLSLLLLCLPLSAAETVLLGDQFLDVAPAAGGTFSPTAQNVKLTWQIEGGVDAGSWPVGNHSLQVDNVYYAKPAYYVKPGGAGSQNGLTEANAYSSIATALAAATNAGDIIVIMESGSPSYNLSSGLAFSGGGAAVLTTSSLASGSHALTASFAASGNFSASVSTVLNQAIQAAITL